LYSAFTLPLSAGVWLAAFGCEPVNRPLRLDAAARRMMLAWHRHLKRLPKPAGPRLRRPAGS